jgi:endonuclease/exonuclease/phosphatase family metal-dependent hydrolase
MRLLSYNIHKGIGGRDRKYRLERVIDVIREQKPDLVCLQEVDMGVRRSHFHDQPNLLAEQCGLPHRQYHLTVPIQTGGYGNLVLSRWPLQSPEHYCLRFKKRKPRGAQIVVVESQVGQLCLVNWHLGLNGRERLWQADRLVQHPLLQTHLHLPTLIAGDSNDWRNHLAHRVLKHHAFQLATLPVSRFRSFPAFWPVMALDKIYFRGDVEVQQAAVVSSSLARHASDHLPLIVDFHVTLQRQSELREECLSV